MTVHGAKGLQAPVVIIPDVGGGKGEKEIRWGRLDGAELPLWAPRSRSEYHAPAWQDVFADEAARLQEENRLLYVALTRAEDRLLVCGWGKEPKGWYALIEAGFRRLEGLARDPFEPAAFDAPAACDFGGGACLAAGLRPDGAGLLPERAATDGEAAGPLPGWATRPAPPEAEEVAIAPSALPGEQETPAAAPHGAADPGGRRFRRGRVVHALLQHLPERPAGERRRRRGASSPGPAMG